MSTDSENRVVVLIDMDCFYCQVEEKLNPDLKGKPIAVVQYNPWNGGGIIAVNYVARSMGVTRHMGGDEAKEKCPELQLPSVPCLRGKADISKYREAGKEVAKVLQKFSPLLERASIDKTYLDITALVQDRASSLNVNTIRKDSITNTFALGYDSVVGFIADIQNYCSDSLEFDNEHAKQLLIGSVIVSEIRAEVFNETGYRCSAGIAHNKILAKLVCGMNKPDKQTVLPKHSINILFSTLHIKKVKNLGGKFGDTVCETLKITNMSQLQSFTLKELQSTFDEKNGLWLYNIARGIDLEPVEARFNSKNIGCCNQLEGKSALLDLDSLKKCLTELGDEIEDRLEKDSLENSRTPKQMIVSFCTSLKDGRDVRSSTYYKFTSDDELCGKLFMSKALNLIMELTEGRKLNGDESNRKLKAPIKFLGISVGKFEDNNNSKRTKKIVDYFASNSTIDATRKINDQTIAQESKTDSKSKRNSNGKEYLLDKYFKDTSNEKSLFTAELKSDDFQISTEEPILEMQKTLYAQLLNHENKRNDMNTHKLPEMTADHIKTVHPSPPVCDVVNNCEDINDGTDYSGSTINMEINKSIALFEESDHELLVDRISNMRQLMNSRKLLNHNDEDSQNVDADDSSADEKVESTIVNNSVNKSETNTVVDNEKNVDETFQCSLCDKNIAIDKVDIHSDFHLALQLGEEERQQAPSNRIATKITVTGESNKRKSKSENVSSQKSDLASVARFFVKLDNRIPTEICPECSNRVQKEKLPEHMDFHEAQKLSRELNHKSIVYQTGSNVKRKRVSTSRIKKPKVQCKTIDSFFK